MRPYVIVTIQTVNKDFVYDTEVPTNVPAGRLAKVCKRLDSTIPEDMDFLEAGIWSGDIIIIS